MTQKLNTKTTSLWQRIVAVVMTLFILLQAVPAGTLAALESTEEIAPQNVDALVMQAETDASEEGYTFGDPITFSTTVKGDGINNGGIVRIVLPANVKILSKTETVDDSRIAGVTVQGSAQVVEELLNPEEKSVQTPTEGSIDEPAVQAQEADGASQEEAAIEVPAGGAIAIPVETPEEENAEDTTSIEESSEVNSEEESSNGESSEESSEEEISSEVTSEEDEKEETKPEVPVETTKKVALTPELIEALQSGETVIEYELVDGFTGDLELTFTIALVNEEAWEGVETLNVTGTFTAFRTAVQEAVPM